MTILGLDYGERTIGVSVSDASKKIALPLSTLTRCEEFGLRKNLSSLKNTIREYNVSLIVLGFPKNLDNTLSNRCEKTLIFQERLAKYCKTEIILWDERFTSVEASKALTETKMNVKKQGEIIDTIAAVFILQGYLNSLNNDENTTNL